MSHPNKDSYSNFVESLALFNKSPDVLIKRIKMPLRDQELMAITQSRI